LKLEDFKLAYWLKKHGYEPINSSSIEELKEEYKKNWESIHPDFKKYRVA